MSKPEPYLGGKKILFVGISGDLKDEYFDEIRKAWGYSRENRRKATEEALKDWIRKKRQEKQQVV